LAKRYTALLIIIFLFLFYFSFADDKESCPCCNAEDGRMEITLEEDRVIKDYLDNNIISPNFGLSTDCFNPG